MPALATEVVRRAPAVVAATGGEPAALAIKRATSTIPIVFSIGGDPAESGLAASYSRPGGNATGISLLTNTLEPKRLGLMRELLPRAKTIGVLLNPKFSRVAREHRSRDHSGIRRCQPATFERRRRHRGPFLRHAAGLAHRTCGALLTTDQVPVSAVRGSRRSAEQRYRCGCRVPAGRRLRGPGSQGGKPADLPVMQASKFEFVINLKTAKALGLTIPPSLLQRADQVIE